MKIFEHFCPDPTYLFFTARKQRFWPVRDTGGEIPLPDPTAASSFSCSLPASDFKGQTSKYFNCVGF